MAKKITGTKAEWLASAARWEASAANQRAKGNEAAAAYADKIAKGDRAIAETRPE